MLYPLSLFNLDDAEMYRRYLRDNATSDFVWALYEAADIMEIS